MKYRSTLQARRALTELAVGQEGYFTAKQAQAVGYAKQHVEYHVNVGNFERVGHGLFRLPGVARGKYGELIRLSLWSRGRDDRPQAVVSHETALAVHGLADWPAEGVHLTVPRSFRKRAPVGCVLHKAELDEEDMEQREGFRVVTRQRAMAEKQEAAKMRAESDWERSVNDAGARMSDAAAARKGTQKTKPTQETRRRARPSETTRDAKRVEWASWMG